MKGYNVSEDVYSHLQYSPKIMHAQEVAQEVLAPQEHASGKKKLNCAFNARSSKRVQDPIHKKTQEATSPTTNRK